jgi:hypothetical protein
MASRENYQKGGIRQIEFNSTQAANTPAQGLLEQYRQLPLELFVAYALQATTGKSMNFTHVRCGGCGTGRSDEMRCKLERRARRRAQNSCLACGT